MRRIVSTGLVAIALFAIAGARAAVAGEISSSGFVEDVDIDSGTVQIKGRMFRVTFRSELLDVRGERMRLRQLDVMNPGPWVQYTARDRAGDVEISRMSIVADDE
ncbi:MAG: hypothetical protein AAEJ52_07180 [Myxococcota bacterium]